MTAADNSTRLLDTTAVQTALTLLLDSVDTASQPAALHQCAVSLAGQPSAATVRASLCQIESVVKDLSAPPTLDESQDTLVAVACARAAIMICRRQSFTLLNLALEIGATRSYWKSQLENPISYYVTSTPRRAWAFVSEHGMDAALSHAVRFERVSDAAGWLTGNTQPFKFREVHRKLAGLAKVEEQVLEALGALVASLQQLESAAVAGNVAELYECAVESANLNIDVGERAEVVATQAKLRRLLDKVRVASATNNSGVNRWSGWHAWGQDDGSTKHAGSSTAQQPGTLLDYFDLGEFGLESGATGRCCSAMAAVFPVPESFVWSGEGELGSSSSSGSEGENEGGNESGDDEGSGVGRGGSGEAAGANDNDDTSLNNSNATSDTTSNTTTTTTTTTNNNNNNNNNSADSPGPHGRTHPTDAVATLLHALHTTKRVKVRAHWSVVLSEFTIPSHIQRWWPVYATGVSVGLFGWWCTRYIDLDSVYASVGSAYASAAALVGDFYQHVIVDNVKSLYSTIRYDETTLITSQEAVESDAASLARMISDLASEHGVSGDELNAVVASAGRGNISFVLELYEAEIKTPIRSVVMGDMVRSLLIQVQKQKVDIERAKQALDKIMRSNALTIQMIASIPLVVFGGVLLYQLREAQRVWRGIGDGAVHADLRRLLRRVEIELNAQASDDTLDYSQCGRLYVNLYWLEKDAERLGWSEKDAFVEDLRELEDHRRTVTQHLHTLSRMYRTHAFLAARCVY